jgi:hypothetical protein
MMMTLFHNAAGAVCLSVFPAQVESRKARKQYSNHPKCPVSPFVSSNRAKTHATSPRMFVSFRSKPCYAIKKRKEKVE